MCWLQYSAEIQLLLSHISSGKFLYSTYFFFVLTLFPRTYAQISEAETDYQIAEKRKYYMSLYQYQMKLCSWNFFSKFNEKVLKKNYLQKAYLSVYV